MYLFGSVWYPDIPQNVFIVIDYEVTITQCTSTLPGYPSPTGDKWVVPAMPGVAILGNRCLGRTGLVWLWDLFDNGLLLVFSPTFQRDFYTFSV